jgi:hypothetical protein
MLSQALGKLVIIKPSAQILEVRNQFDLQSTIHLADDISQL